MRVVGLEPSRVADGRVDCVEVEASELGPGADVELAEDVSQVEVDGAGAEEQLCCDVPVAQALRDEASDLQLLGR
jgi:hypothetical protein